MGWHCERGDEHFTPVEAIMQVPGEGGVEGFFLGYFC